LRILVQGLRANASLLFKESAARTAPHDRGAREGGLDIPAADADMTHLATNTRSGRGRAPLVTH
jgi:hypothetical protein